MADETKNTGKIIGYVIGGLTVVAILVGLTPDGWLRKMFTPTPTPPGGTGTTGTTGTTGVRGSKYVDSTPDLNYNGENRCVLRNSRGEEITISSAENNELFQRYCRGGNTEPVYLYNNYWYPYRYWYPRYWGRRWYFTGHTGGSGSDGGTGGSGGGTGGGAGNMGGEGTGGGTT